MREQANALLADIEQDVGAQIGHLVGEDYFAGFMGRHRSALLRLLGNALAQRRASMAPRLQVYVDGFAELWASPTSPATWAAAVRTGSKLARTLLAVRRPPSPRKAKALAAASKAFMSARSTRSTYKWYARNKRHGDLLLEAARSWAPIEDAGDLSLPFAVHWQPDLPLDRAHTRHLLRQACSAVRTSCVPGLDDVLYGSVYVVGALAGRRRLAWYYPDLDTVFVRYRASEGAAADTDFMHSVIHELGHRYWKTLLADETKQAWSAHHRRLKRAPLPGTAFPARPSVGDVLSFPLHGVESSTPVQRVDGDRLFTSARSYVSWSRLQGLLRWPTAYSKKNAEEHFCEALGLFVLGEAQAWHADVFRETVCNG